MFFKLNDIVLGQGKYHIQSPIRGLAQAPIRIDYGDYSGKDGGYISSQFYSPREIVIEGFIIGKSCEETEELRKNLVRALKIRQALPLFITNFTGKRFVTEVYLSDLKIDITNSIHCNYQITLISPDPFLYDAGDEEDPNSGFVTNDFYKPLPGGYITPYNIPVQWVSGTTMTLISNAGDIDILPEIVLAGKYTNPVVVNATTGKFMKLNITTSAADTILIDMKNREITLNGGSIAPTRTIDSSWWSLLQGNNGIYLSTDSGSDQNSGKIRWRLGYEGI